MKNEIIYDMYKNNARNKHTRQVIAQFANKDILFLSTGGRGYDGEGMTNKDLMRILKTLNVRFAINLDGWRQCFHDHRWPKYK